MHTEVCAGCGDPILHSRILAWVHTDGRYWCFPDDPSDMHRASPNHSIMVVQ